MIRILLATFLIVSCCAANLNDTEKLYNLLRIAGIDKEPLAKLKNSDSDDRLNSFEKCMQGLQHALTPNGVDVLSQMLLNSGKFVNQYGDPETCRDNPNTEYAILKLSGIPFKVELGIWAPADCDSEQVYNDN